MRSNFATLAELYDYSTRKFAKRQAAEFVEGGQSYTYAQIKERADYLSGVLSCFGINSSDKVAILSESMPNWTIAFFAITAFGRIAVPMLPELSANEVENILAHSDTKAIFLSPRHLKKLSQETIDRLHLIINIEDFSFIKAADTEYTCDGVIKTPNPMDIAAILYTSGTTGKAKGVMLSHRNFCWNIREGVDAYRIHKKDKFLSILPMAHTYELSIGCLYPFSHGCRVFYLQKAPTPSVLIETLKKIRPTVMLAVPLIIEKIYKGSIVKTIDKSRYLTHLKKHFPWLLYRLVGIKLKSTFGGRLKFFGIGGAKLDRTVEEFIRKARFPYAIGYGLTETAPLIGYKRIGEDKVGQTGRAGYGIQVKLEDVNPETGEGELLAKGPVVMLGYYKDYARTKDVITEDGWFRTGDLATMDKKGRYTILGRRGSVIIGASGENIYPEEIEDVINGISGVTESLVVQRDGRLVALVKFNDNIFDWNLEGEDEFIKKVTDTQAQILDFVNSQVSRFSKIKDVEIQKEPFVKTATHKIKRYLYSSSGKKGNEQTNNNK